MPEGAAERMALWAGRRGFSLLYPGSGGDGTRFEAREWREGATGRIWSLDVSELEGSRVTRVERICNGEQTLKTLLEFCGFRHCSVWHGAMLPCGAGCAFNGGNIRINLEPYICTCTS